MTGVSPRGSCLIWACATPSYRRSKRPTACWVASTRHVGWFSRVNRASIVFLSPITKTSRHGPVLTGISQARERQYSGADRASFTPCTRQPSGSSLAPRASPAAPSTSFPQGPARLRYLPEHLVPQLLVAPTRPPTLFSRDLSSTGITLFFREAPYSVAQRTYPAASSPWTRSSSTPTP